MPTSSLLSPSLRTRLLAGCCAVLLGGLGVAIHPALPHGGHHGGTDCSVCVHLDGNPPAAAAAPDLPAPKPAAGAAPAPPVPTVHLEPAAASCRAPPAFAVS